MWQKLVELIRRFWNWLTGQKTSALPGTATRIETPPKMPGEPELGLTSGEQPKYQQRDSLFTYRERVFFKALIGDSVIT